jgi:long-chain acyl-CoA synthetase
MTGPSVTYRAWSRVLEDVTVVASYLANSGIEQGMRIGIRGHNTYEWMILDLALLSLGAIPVALPVPDFLGQRNDDLAQRYGLSASFVDRGALEGPDDPTVAPLDDLLSEPPITPTKTSGRSMMAGGREAFTVAFSSGTAGRLKCLLVSWEGCATLIEATNEAYQFQRSDRILVSLPLSTFQQRYLVYLAIRNDCDVVLTTSGRFLNALAQCKPTVMLGPPNFYDFAATRFDGEDRKILRDVAAEMALRVPVSSIRQRLQRLIFRSAHQAYGGKIRLMLVGSAPIRPGVLRFFARAGFPLYQIYGMTETGFLAWNTPAANKFGSVGRPVYPGTVSIDHDGEVLIRHPWHLCVGYEGEPTDEAATVFRADNVIATGDLGRLDNDGFLYLQGRKKNVIITSGGQKIQLEDLENQLGAATGLNRVALFNSGDGQALACVAWFTGDAAGARRALYERILFVNSRLASTVRIEQAALVNGQLDVGSPFLNRNLKLNREAVSGELASRLMPVSDLTITAVNPVD